MFDESRQQKRPILSRLWTSSELLHVYGALLGQQRAKPAGMCAESKKGNTAPSDSMQSIEMRASFPIATVRTMARQGDCVTVLRLQCSHADFLHL